MDKNPVLLGSHTIKLDLLGHMSHINWLWLRGNGDPEILSKSVGSFRVFPATQDGPGWEFFVKLKNSMDL